MGKSDQGLAERIAEQTHELLDVCEELGGRLKGQLEAERLTARKGIRLPPPTRDTMRVFREWRGALERLRAEAILRARLKINLGESMPMSEDEYREEWDKLQAELLQQASREDLERALAERPVVRLPAAAGLAVLDVEGVERPPVPTPPLPAARAASAPTGPAGEPGLAPAPRESEAPAAPAAPASTEPGAAEDPPDGDPGYGGEDGYL